MTLLERRRQMMSRKVKPYWTYIVEIVNRRGSRNINVTEGQTIYIEWDCTTENLNGWVFYGRGCTDWESNQIRYCGATGSHTINVTKTGYVSVGTHGTNAFAVINGTIKLHIE